MRVIHHVDMIRLTREIESRSQDRDVKRLAGTAATALDGLVLRRFAHADREGEFGSHGLSIYFPATRSDFDEDPFQENGYSKTNTYFPVAFVADHRWADFLQAYYGHQTMADPVVTPPAQPAVPVVNEPVSAAAGAALEPLARKLTTQAGVLSGLRDASLTSNLDSGEPAVVLLASNDGVTARARMGYLVTDKSLVDVTFTGPVSGGEALLFDAKGLGNRASVEIRGTFVPWSRQTIRDENGARAGFAESVATFSQLVAETTVKAQRIEDSRLADASNGRQRFRSASALPQATTESVQRAFADIWRREVLGTGKVQVQSALLLSATYTSGSNSYPYLEPDTLEPKKFSERSEGFSGSIGWMRAEGKAFNEGIPRFYFGFSVAENRNVSPKPKTTICKPFGTAEATECSDVSVGRPDPTHNLQFQGDARYWLRARTLATGVRFTYEEQRNGDKSPSRVIEFPFYFLKKVAKVDELPKPGDVPPFTGGVNLGWRTENGARSFFVLLFVGSSFGLPGLP